MTTVAQFERSTYEGTPIEYFLFERGEPVIQTWAFTTASEDQLLGGITYVAGVVIRGDIVADQERGSQNLEFSLPRKHPLILDLVRGLSPVPIRMTMFRRHEGSSNTETPWTGEVSSVSTEGAIGKILCIPLSAGFERQVPRINYLRTCPWMTFDHKCKLVEADFTFEGVVESITGTTVEVSGADHLDEEDYYTVGQMKIGQARMFIEKHDHTLSTVKLLAGLPGLEVGATVELIAGDDKTATTCRDKFSNIPHFGGFPFIPSKNPMESLD